MSNIFNIWISDISKFFKSQNVINFSNSENFQFIYFFLMAEIFKFFYKIWD